MLSNAISLRTSRRCRGRRRGDRANRALERAIEANAQRLASEDFDPARVREDVSIATRRMERAKRFAVAVDDAPPIDDERGDAWRPAIARPCARARRHLSPVA